MDFLPDGGEDYRRESEDVMTKRTRLFDNLDHGLLMKALRKRCEEHWILLYVERWPKAFAVSRFERITEGSLSLRNRTIFKVP